MFLDIYSFTKESNNLSLDKVFAVLCTSGCTLRCTNCGKPEIQKFGNKNTDEKTIIDFIKKSKNKNICITGGDPLEQPDFIDFLMMLRMAGAYIRLDTVGTYPEKLKKIIDSGYVDYISMNIKTSRERYYQIIDKNINLSDIDKSIDIIKSSEIEYEFSTVVVKELHDEKIIADIGKWLDGAKQYYINQYNRNNKFTQYTMEELSKFYEILKTHIEQIGIRWLS